MNKKIYVVLKAPGGEKTLCRFHGPASQIEKVHEGEVAPRFFTTNFYGPSTQWTVEDIVFRDGHPSVQILEGLRMMEDLDSQDMISRIFEAGVEAGSRKR